jgi:Domain of unknown function (DUF4372)
VFHDLQKHLPWAEFDRLVEAYNADARVRRLSTKSQLIALLYAQLSALPACARSRPGSRATRRGSITWGQHRRTETTTHNSHF